MEFKKAKHNEYKGIECNYIADSLSLLPDVNEGETCLLVDTGILLEFKNTEGLGLCWIHKESYNLETGNLI